MIRADKGQLGMIGLAMALVLLFSTGLVCTAATSARTVLQYTSSLSRSICDWLCPGAYAADPGNAPVAHWRFDEGGGPTAYDESANNNDGTLVNHTKFVNGKIGKALQLDGTDDKVQVADSASLSITGTDLTLEAWIKPNGGDGDIIHKEVQYTIYRYNDGTITYADSTIWSYATVGKHGSTPAGQWSHVAVTRDASSVKFYINGKYIDSYSCGSSITDNANPVYIGSYNGTSDYFNGLIDDVKIYNYARTADQIMVDYNAGSAAHLGAGTDPNEGNAPVGYWNFDENTGATAFDRSGNGNNGAINGSSAWTQGKNGHALSFNGTSDYVTVSDSASLNSSALSISMWIKPSQIKTGQGSNSNAIMGREVYQTKGFRFSIAANGQLIFWTSESGGTLGIDSGATILSSGNWYHVAVSYDGSSGKMYINGIQVGSGTGAYVIPTSVTLSIIGGFGGGLLFNGLVDDVKIYNYARTAAQIAYDYNRGEPVAHYKFDEGGGAIAKNEFGETAVQPDKIANLKLWLKADSISGLMDGSAVATWSDASGNGINFTQSTESRKPVYKANIVNGQPVVRFTAASQQTMTNSTAFSTPITVIYAVRQTGGANARMLSGVNNNWLLGYWSGGKRQAYFEGWVSSSGTPATDTSWHIYSVVQTGALSTVYEDGTQFVSNANGVAAPNGLSLCGHNAASEFSNGDIAEVIVYNSALQTSDLKSVEAYLRNKYNIATSATTHGTLAGSNIKFVDGKIGKALQFNGTDDYVDCGNNSLLDFTSGDFTIAVWIKTTDTGGTIIERGLSQTDGYTLMFDPYVHLLTHQAGAYTYVRSQSPANSGTWEHWVAVRQGTNARLYRNGVENVPYTGGTPTAIANAVTSARLLTIGKGNTWGITNGLIDDVRIYNYSRSQDQVLQDYNAGFSARFGAQSIGTADPWGGAMPALWWKLDENTGVVAYDSAGNSNNGTLKYSPTWDQAKMGSGVKTGAQAHIDGPIGIINGNETIEMWIKPRVIGSAMCLWAFDTGPGVTPGCIGQSGYVNANGTVQANNYDGNWDSAVSTIALTAGNWYHIAASLTGGTNNMNIYINGVLAGTSTTTGVNGFGMFTIGNTHGNCNGTDDDTADVFDGIIDDVKYYQYVRTPAQVAWDYNRGEPLAHYKFDEATSGSAVGSTNIKDNSGNGYHGSGSGSNIAWAAGKFQGALSFNGTNDVVDCGNITALNFGNNPFSISVWFKNVSPSGYDTIMGKGGFWANDEFQMYTLGGNLRFYVNKAGAQYDVPYAISANQWYHAVGTYDGSYIKLYVNGVFRGQTAVSNLNIGNATSFRIGNAAGDPFNGLIDDVRVYNYARTQDQILQDFNNGAAARLGD